MSADQDGGIRRRQEIFGAYEIAFECLADAERTRRLIDAVQSAARAAKSALEIGTGTGILSLAAARAGMVVTALEVDAETAGIARANVATNRFADRISVLCCDAIDSLSLSLSLGEGVKFDLLIAELITTGLIEEQLVPAVNAVIAADLMVDSAAAIPMRQLTEVALSTADFEFFGFDMPSVMIEQTWQPTRIRQHLTQRFEVDTVDVSEAVRHSQPICERVDRSLRLEASASGSANAVTLTSRSALAPTIEVGWTMCMNSPIVAPLEERSLQRGDVVGVDISYEMGGGLGSLEVCWR